MNEPTAKSSDSFGPANAKLWARGPWLELARKFLYLGLAVAVAVLLYVGYKARREDSDLKESQENLANSFGVIAQVHRQLALEYTDKQGRLMADPPPDARQLLNPDTLVLAYGEDSDLEVQPINWQELQADLEQTTGKKVATQPYTNTVSDVADFKEGRIHIVALHAADTPYLVNNAGFIPAAVLGSDSGAIGNHLDLAVAPKSGIRKLSDLKGRTLTSTNPQSITGHRAAVAVLLQDAGLRPDIDYTINYSLGQTRSILGIASDDYEAAAWSDDKLQTLLKAGRIQPTDYRIIYESHVIPRFTIGYGYNLDPGVAAKVRQAVLDFKNAGGPADEASGKPMHFVAIDYKKDFEFVRKMDESFEPRLGAKPAKSKSTPAATQAD
jgi:phosphonate transport system substrate-binding protein